MTTTRSADEDQLVEELARARHTRRMELHEAWASDPAVVDSELAFARLEPLHGTATFAEDERFRDAKANEE